MIRLVYCVSRSKDISVEEFRRYWNDEQFSVLMNDFKKLYKAIKTTKNLVLNVPMNTTMLERQGTREPYDGIIELWWESAKDLIALNETPEAEGFRQEMRAFEKQFIDKSRSTIFFSEYFE